MLGPMQATTWADESHEECRQQAARQHGRLLAMREALRRWVVLVEMTSAGLPALVRGEYEREVEAALDVLG